MEKSKDQEPNQSRKRSTCCCWSLNSLPSIWYGLIVVILQVYIGVQGGRRFFHYLNSSSTSANMASWELNLYVALQGLAVVLLPMIAVSAIFKMGNLANDGFRLGRRLDLELDLDLPRPRSRAQDPLATSGSACGAAWRHCPPLNPLLHAIAALCCLVAKLVFEARLIKDGLIHKENVWRTDLDFIMESIWMPATSLIKDAPFPCPEFLSYCLALLALSVRSADVYWGANKCLAFIISLQLLVSSAHALLAVTGASILYKVQLIGLYGQPTSNHGPADLLLDPPITVMLLLLLCLTLLLACSPFTMYSLNKLSSFLMRSRRRYMQELPAARSYLWRFYPHLAALATLLAVAACAAPILHDLSKLYRINPHPVLLICVTGSIVHAFLWVATWLLLTAKSRWDFRLKISVGRTLVKSPSCLALAAQIEYHGHEKNQSEETENLLKNTSSPVLVLSGGKAYAVQDSRAQKKIQEILDQRAGSKDGENHQVYWLKGNAELPSPSSSGSLSSPSLPEPISSSNSSSSSTGGGSPTANTTPAPSSNPLPAGVSGTLSPIVTRPARRPLVRLPEDDGDYATLRDLPLVTLPEEPANLSVINDTNETSSSSDSSGVDSGFGSGGQSSKRVVMATPVHPRITRDLCNPYGYVKPKLTTFAQPLHSNTIALHGTPQMQHRAAPFHSLPLGHRPMSSHLSGNPHSVMIHSNPVEDRRPVIQACLFAGQGLEMNIKPASVQS